jgi:hypothetical protein
VTNVSTEERQVAVGVTTETRLVSAPAVSTAAGPAVVPPAVAVTQATAHVNVIKGGEPDVDIDLLLIYRTAKLLGG